MPNIAEHDAKKERESGATVDGRIDFLIQRDSVGISDCLENICELVRTEISWWLDFFVRYYFKVKFEITRVVLG